LEKFLAPVEVCLKTGNFSLFIPYSGNLPGYVDLMPGGWQAAQFVGAQTAGTTPVRRIRAFFLFV
jgi:hypothetical protein